MLDVSPEEYVAEDLPESPGHHTLTLALTAIVKARLWKLSQRRLFDRTAARKLKPLGCTDEAFVQSLGSQVVLDEGYASSQGRDMVEEALEVREMLDEGYCSQKTGSKHATGNDNDLLFSHDSFALEEDIWESDLLFDREETDIADGSLDDDLFWEEDGPFRESILEEDLCHGGESIMMDDLSHEECELVDSSKLDRGRGLHDNIEDEVLDNHLHHISNPLSEARYDDYSYYQACIIREEEMLLAC